MKELELFDHVVLNKSNIRLIPLSFEHESGLMEACKIMAQLMEVKSDINTTSFCRFINIDPNSSKDKNRKVHVIHLLSLKKTLENSRYN